MEEAVLNGGAGAGLHPRCPSAGTETRTAPGAQSRPRRQRHAAFTGFCAGSAPPHEIARASSSLASSPCGSLACSERGKPRGMNPEEIKKGGDYQPPVRNTLGSGSGPGDGYGPTLDATRSLPSPPAYDWVEMMASRSSKMRDRVSPTCRPPRDADDLVEGSAQVADDHGPLLDGRMCGTRNPLTSTSDCPAGQSGNFVPRPGCPWSAR
jgi:hypothetical protein